MRYKALPAKADIDPEVALLQAVSALDAAAETAEKTNDVEGLLNTAAMWLRVSGAIGSYTVAVQEEEDKVLKATEGRFQTGFQVPAITAEEEIENE